MCETDFKDFSFWVVAGGDVKTENADVARLCDALREKKRKGDTVLNFGDVFYYSHLEKIKTEILFNAIMMPCGSLIAIEAC
mgnify:CR=1 FL=1